MGESPFLPSRQPAQHQNRLPMVYQVYINVRVFSALGGAGWLQNLCCCSFARYRYRLGLAEPVQTALAGESSDRRNVQGTWDELRLILRWGIHFLSGRSYNSHHCICRSMMLPHCIFPTLFSHRYCLWLPLRKSNCPLLNWNNRLLKLVLHWIRLVHKNLPLHKKLLPLDKKHWHLPRKKWLIFLPRV